MSPIDHTARAIDAIEVARNASTNEFSTVHALIAQAEATLALVEQQKLANRIAYVTFLEMQFAEGAKHPEEFSWDSREASNQRHKRVVSEIRDGLGLS